MTKQYSETEQDDFSEAIDRGLEDVKKGRTVSLKEARKRLSISPEEFFDSKAQVTEDFMADRNDSPAQERDLL